MLDILPGATWSHFISALTLTGYLFTYQDVILQILQPLNTAVVDVDGNWIEKPLVVFQYQWRSAPGVRSEEHTSELQSLC